MKRKYPFSRRDFLKSSAIASTAFIGGASLSGCSNQSLSRKKPEVFPIFHGENYKPADGPAGLLFSQVGYEPGYPVRILIRLPEKEHLPDQAKCHLTPTFNENPYEASCEYWGEVWGSHWWIANFTTIKDQGEWEIELRNGTDCLIRDTGLKVEKNILWNKTIEWSAVDMLERRLHFTKVGAGWQDAGTLWVESPAQSAMIIALAELLDRRKNQFDDDFLKRIYRQITVGCDYLVMTEEKATELGFQPGAMSHDLLGHEKDVLPADVMKAVVALLRAVQLLPDEYEEKRKRYQETANRSYHWLVNKARPMGDYGLSRFQRGLPEDIEIPDDERQTRDLMTMCQAGLEMWKLGNPQGRDTCVQNARRIMARQIPKNRPENGYYGHFLEYDSMAHSEKAWSHGIVKNQFGADIGQIYPNYLMPFIEMLALWPDHEDAAGWKETLTQFTYGYLIPVCEKNPFNLIPLGIFGSEGPIWFCGTFHGTNTVYGYTAALALELAKLFDEPKLKDIAYGNLQWLAGLNAGITRESLSQGCVIFSTDLPEGGALPASMICGIGRRWAGTWFQTRGVICNGFTTGKQFVYDVEPKKENDGPFSLTDEDWIPHSAGWLTALVRL